MKPERGAIAVCSQGGVGLITSDMPEERTRLGKTTEVWTGVYLTHCVCNGQHKRPGDPWESSRPTVISSCRDASQYANLMAMRRNAKTAIVRGNLSPDPVNNDESKQAATATSSA